MRYRRKRKIAIRKDSIQSFKPSGTYETTLTLNTGETVVIKNSYENLIRELNSPLRVESYISCTQLIEEPSEEEVEAEGEGEENV